MQVDLTGADVVDAHCHPFRTQDLLDRDPRRSRRAACTWARRCSRPTTRTTSWPRSWRSSPRRRCSAWRSAGGSPTYLGCEPTKDAVVAARDAALRADPTGYVRGLLDSEHVVAVVADEGYPQPTIPRADFEEALGGVPVHRVGRIEPWIVDAREEGTFDDTVQRIRGGRERRRERSAAHRLQDDHRLPHRPGHHGSVVERTRRRRTIAGAPTTGARRASTRSRCGTSCCGARSNSRRSTTACSTCTSAAAIRT